MKFWKGGQIRCCKGNYQGDTDLLSSDYPSQKENTDEDFQPGW